MSKHRKWLAELQETKDKLEMQYALELQRKEEAKEKVSSMLYRVFVILHLVSKQRG